MITKQDILEYVMNSPYNTNPNVLNPMLEEYGEGSGSGGDCLLATLDPDSFKLNKTWQEIHDALEEYGVGKVIIVKSIEEHDMDMVTETGGSDREGYWVNAQNGGMENSYICSSKTDYPIYD